MKLGFDLLSEACYNGVIGLLDGLSSLGKERNLDTSSLLTFGKIVKELTR